MEEVDRIARENGWSRPVSAQNRYSLLHREPENDLLPVCERLGIGVLPYFPLASGLLTGKYKGGIPPGSRGALENMSFLVKSLTYESRNAAVERLEGIATELGCTVAQLAIAWCARNPNVSSVITGASKLEQLRSNLAAADVVDKLSPEVLTRIDAITQPLAQ